MAAWGNQTITNVPAPLSLKSIIEEQKLTKSSNSDTEDADFTADEFEYQNEEYTTDDCVDDQTLARMLQQMENEDSAASYEANLSQDQKRQSEQNKYSKISVVSRYDTSTTTLNRSYVGPNIVSSGYHEAMLRESQMNSVGVDSQYSSMFKGGVTMLPDGNFISKHDSLLNSLSNSVKLTEIDGVGDLSGNGLLVGNSVANSIRSSAQKKRSKA
jgi:hypothetical protein